MTYYYNEELQHLQEKQARKRRLEKMVNDLHSHRTELQSKVRELQLSEQKRRIYLERLESRGFLSLFYSMTGRKEEKLDEQRREAYTITRKHDAAVRELAAVEDSIRQYDSELVKLSGCDMEYARVLKEKVKVIKATKNPVSEKILQYEENIAYLKNQKAEIYEVIVVGNKAKATEEEILNELENAEGWEIWDLFGGGLISDLAKHSSLGEVQEKIEQLQVLLSCFRTELADVTMDDADIQVNIDGFLRFADYFFDGLFADGAVLDRIEKSQAQVRQTGQQIEKILKKMTEMICSIDEELDDTVQKMEMIIQETDICEGTVPGDFTHGK